MDITREKPQKPARRPMALAWVGMTLVAGAATLWYLRHLKAASAGPNETGFDASDEQAVTVRVSREQAEAGWVQWCASGHAKLKNDYAIRFEPAPGARGTEVYLSGGGTQGRTREELGRFKQFLETGELI